MEYLYTIISVVGWVFFFFRKRRSDFMTIGFASQQIYFSPCLIQALDISKDLNSSPLHYGVSLTGTILVFLFLLFSIPTPIAKSKATSKPIIDITYHPEIATAVAVLAFLVSTYQVGIILFTSPKKDVLESINRFYILWTMASLYGVSTALYLRKRKVLLVNFALILLTVYIGFRSVAAIAAIVFFAMQFRDKNSLSLVRHNILASMVIFLVAGLFFVYKGVYLPIKFGMYDVAIERLLNPEFYTVVFLSSEPFGIQRILSDVIEHDFFIGPGNLTRIIYSFIMFAEQFGLEAQSFNSYFQPVLYARADYGVGSNVWAHMYSSGGWLLLIIFSILYVLSLRIASSLMRNANPSFIPLIILLSSYWAFYIHRNDLFYQVGLERRILIVFVITSLISIFLSSTKKRFK